MRKPGLQWLGLTFLGSVLLSTTSVADSFFEVTITNITKGVVFTPIMVASTRKGDTFYGLGEAATGELEALAETGDTGPLQGSLDAYDIANSSFLGPGESVTEYVATRGPYNYLSIASMVIPTNDAFFAVNGIAGPRGKKTMTITAPAYDAGTELNDELCASLPGPGCGEDPGPVSDNGEGYVHISSGIRGVGDLDADALDWNNPVAIIRITRVRDHDKD